MTAPDIPAEEERLLARVLASLAAHAPAPRAARPTRRNPRKQPRRPAPVRRGADRAARRDRRGAPRGRARARRADGAAAEASSLTRADLQTILVDPATPYFGHLRLREEVRGRGAVERDVLIGRATFVDAAAASTSSTGATRRSASSSTATPRAATTRRRFGDREVEGEIVARRTLTIEDGVLRRVACPQGVWVRAGADGGWERTRRADVTSSPAARRPRTPGRRARGVLGAAPAGRPGARSPPARDRGADRSASVRAHHGARRGRRRHPGRRRQRQDDRRAAPPRATWRSTTRTRFAPAKLARRDRRRRAGGLHRTAAPLAGRGGRRASLTFAELGGARAARRAPLAARPSRRRGRPRRHARQEPPRAAARAGAGRRRLRREARPRGRRSKSGATS